MCGNLVVDEAGHKRRMLLATTALLVAPAARLADPSLAAIRSLTATPGSHIIRLSRSGRDRASVCTARRTS
jgi:hypothetical protein